MRILLLADAASVHTVKWATGLAGQNIEIGIFSLNEAGPAEYGNYRNIIVFTHKFLQKKGTGRGRILGKAGYLLALSELIRAMDSFRPDILHAHYATSYGLLGALAGFHPYIVSVWGSDVFVFPKKSFLHRLILKYNLSRADCILSTSRAMADETARYTDKTVKVIPFGIDLSEFSPMKAESLFSAGTIVLGTVKALEKEYGIDCLMKAFAIVRRRNDTLPLKLLLVGGGTQAKHLMQLADVLNIKRDTVFAGRIPHSEAARYHNMLTISVAVSYSESFGVSVLEAGACEKAVIVSAAGGLPEVVENEVTGLVVPPHNVEKTAEAMERLILDKNLRERMGKNGRIRIGRLFSWNNNLRQMMDVYKEMLSL